MTLVYSPQEDQGWQCSMLGDWEGELGKPLMQTLKLPHIELLVWMEWLSPMSGRQTWSG